MADGAAERTPRFVALRTEEFDEIAPAGAARDPMRQGFACGRCITTAVVEWHPTQTGQLRRGHSCTGHGGKSRVPTAPGAGIGQLSGFPGVRCAPGAYALHVRCTRPGAARRRRSPAAADADVHHGARRPVGYRIGHRAVWATAPHGILCFAAYQVFDLDGRVQMNDTLVSDTVKFEGARAHTRVRMQSPATVRVCVHDHACVATHTHTRTQIDAPALARDLRTSRLYERGLRSQACICPQASS